MRYIIALLVLSLAVNASDLDVRHLYMTNDVTATRPAVAPLKWYGGESVKFDLWAVRGTNPIDLSASGLYARWESFGTNLSLAYIMSTGTIYSASNGWVKFDLTPEAANLPTGTYSSFVKLYQPIGGTNRYVGTIAKTDLQVLWGPSASSVTYAGPYGGAFDYIAYSNLAAGLNIQLVRSGSLLTINGVVTSGVAGVSSVTNTADIEATEGGVGNIGLTLSDARLASLLKADSALTNPAQFATAAQGERADMAPTNTSEAYPLTGNPSGFLLPASTQNLATVAQLSGYVPTSRTVTINGTIGNFSSNLDFTISVTGGAGVVGDYVSNGMATVNGNAISNGAAISLTAANVGALGLTGGTLTGNLYIQKTLGIGVWDNLQDESFVDAIYWTSNHAGIVTHALLNEFTIPPVMSGAGILSGTIASQQVASATDDAYRNPTTMVTSVEGRAGLTNITGMTDAVILGLSLRTQDSLYRADLAVTNFQTVTLYSTNLTPSGSELPSLNYVRSLLNSGVYYYNSTNTIVNGYSATGYVYQATTPAPFNRSYGIASNNQYVGEVFTPSILTNATGPATVTIYARVSGGGNPTVTISPELYFTADLTNTIYEAADVPSQTIAASTTSNSYQWVFSFPQQTSPVYAMRRLKVISFSGTPTLTLYGGSNQVSTLAISSSSGGGSGTGGGATGEDITNVFKQATWTPYAIPYSTNITVDVTNGNAQACTLTGPTTINLSAVQTNLGQTIFFDLIAGTNPVTWAASISNNSSISPRATGTTPVKFSQPFMQTYWRVNNR